jgi:hypothetical protein
MYIFFLIFAIPMMIINLANLIDDYATHRKIEASKNWPKTNGMVTDARLDYSFKGGKGENICAKIKYKYKVAESEYIGKFEIKGLWGSRNDAIKYIEQFPNGLVLPVCYNPQIPQEVVTQYDGTYPLDLVQHIGMFIASIVFVVIFISLIFSNVYK